MESKPAKDGTHTANEDLDTEDLYTKYKVIQIQFKKNNKHNLNFFSKNFPETPKNVRIFRSSRGVHQR